MRARAVRDALRRFVKDERGGLFAPSAASSRLTPPDASTALYYKFEESSPPFKNSGQAGSLDVTLVSGSAGSYQRTGLFGRCLGASASDFATANTSVGETAGAFSMHCWVNMWAFSGTAFPELFTKQYRGDGSWSSPFASVQLNMTNANDGTWQAVATIAGTAKAVVAGNPWKIPINQWCHVGMTSDMNTLTAYFNGEIVGTTSLGTNVGVDWGTHGRWLFLGNPAATAERASGRIDEARFEWTLRSAAYMQALYKAGAGLFE